MNKIAIVYWSGSGNTEAMANYIADGIRTVGGEAACKELGGKLAAW